MRLWRRSRFANFVFLFPVILHIVPTVFSLFYLSHHILFRYYGQGKQFVPACSMGTDEDCLVRVLCSRRHMLGNIQSKYM